MAADVDAGLLLDRIVADLVRDDAFIIFLDGGDVERIERVRALGRKAGRLLGWKVRTFASDPGRRSDGKVIVMVESWSERDKNDPIRVPQSVDEAKATK